jgi:uncharacterized protein YndB with AHSA1/START domain
MAGQTAGGPQTASAHANGDPGVEHGPPGGVAAATLPPLAPMSFPIVRDRWERLVTTATIPAPPERIWRALTRPDELRMWLARCHGAVDRVAAECVLDFEDGEFFLVSTQSVDEPQDGEHGELRWVWRWLGIGQPASVTWRLDPDPAGGATVTATEECINPPADWQTWNGGGWPGILDQLALYLRTGTEWRWPWRRMGPYVQTELPASPFEAWDTIMNPAPIKFWLQRMDGDIRPGESVTVMMGDASGTVELVVRAVVDPGEEPPSFLPYVNFGLRRPAWGGELGGRLWIEPAGWGRSLLQVFHFGWESLPPGPAIVEERKVLTTFWVGAARRAAQLFMRPGNHGGPHSWS